MKLGYASIIAVVAYIFSSTLLPIFRINEALPNFGIIFSIILLVLFSDKHAFAFAVVFGSMQDLFLSRVIGIHLIAYIVVIYSISKWIEVLFKANYITPIFLMIVGTWLFHLVYLVFAFFLQITLPLDILLSRVMTETLMNALIGLGLYAIVFKKVHGYKLGDYNA